MENSGTCRVFAVSNPVCVAILVLRYPIGAVDLFGIAAGTHLSKNKVCSIILIAFGGLFTIAGLVILRVGATGFAAIGIGVAALILLNGAEKEYFNWKRNK